MEKELIAKFLNKRIAFRKEGIDRTFLGELIEIYEISVLIQYKGQLQTHRIIDILDIEEQINQNGVV